MTDPRIEVLPHADAIARVSAAELVKTVVAAQRAHGTASIVITGGGNGIAVLKALRTDSGDIDWSAVNVFFGDERFVPHDDDERNEKQAREALFDHAPMDRARLHPMAASDGPYGNDIASAAQSYADLIGPIVSNGGFDLHLLGMGGEGHINSLFPHTPAVREDSTLVVAVEDSPKPPSRRITLTLPAINSSARVWFLVSGEGKAEAVLRSVKGASTDVCADDWPAAGAHGTDETVWFIDPAASSKLPQK